MTAPRVYLDHNATTPLRPEVREAMRRWLAPGAVGNPSSVHAEGRAARRAVEEARQHVAALAGRPSDVVVFTGGGGAANDLAIRLTARPGSPFAASAVEHPSILGSGITAGPRVRGPSDEPANSPAQVAGTPLAQVAGTPQEPVVIGVDRQGIVLDDEFRKALGSRPSLVAVMVANNVTGAIQPVPRLSELALAAGVPLLADAVQAATTLDLAGVAKGASALTLSAHKMGGPMGVGALVGWPDGRTHNETENVAGIVGMGEAARLAKAERATHARHLERLRDRLEQVLLVTVPGTRVNASGASRVPGTSSIAFEDASAETLLVGLDLAGIACSAGAACASGSTEPSHVLLAMGQSRREAGAALRFSFGSGSDDGDVDAILQRLPPILERARARAPAPPRSRLSP